MEEHRRIVRQVLQILETNQLFLKPEKCEFEKKEVEYLGIRLQAGQLAMDPSNLEVSRIGLPRKTQRCSRIPWFHSFYRRFIRNYPVSLVPSMISPRKPPLAMGRTGTRRLR